MQYIVDEYELKTGVVERIKWEREDVTL